MRELSRQEQLAINLIKVYEKALTNHNNTMKLEVSKVGLRAISEGVNNYLFTVLKVDTMGIDCFHVHFKISEFEMYLHFILAQSAMALLEDYTLILQDGLEYQLDL